MKPILSLLLCLLCAAASATAATPKDDALLEKAARAYSNREWASATALYGVFCDRSPGHPEAYARRVVASEIISDTISSVDAIEEALNAEVEPAAFFDLIRSEAFAAARPMLVPQVLMRAKARMPWMGRPIDAALLRFYSFRNDAEATQKYAESLLNGLPDDTEYLSMLAGSLLAQGKDREAVEIYERILQKDPQNFDALIILGNYSIDEGQTDKGLQYLRKALQIKPTPALRKSIESISKQ
ncbi:MAG: hypothetical protein K2M06_05735 [Muribaculaceae bacterium]|nr:hypothetical protein [Muribaculaceae bacterium]